MKINKETICELTKEYGDSFYLLDSLRFQNNFLELRNAFSEFYPNSNIAYSYKTNYIPQLCKIVNKLGGYAEVVSEMELEIAGRIGCKYNRIIWNGPIKNQKVMEDFLVNGGTVNIDSYEELELIKQIHNRYENVVLNIGIRCNYDVKDGVLSRFGFDINSPEFKNAVEYLSNTDNIKLINFQCHFAKRQIDYWPERVYGMLRMLDRFAIIPERIDIGGGLYGKMPEFLERQFGNKIPSYRDYAEIAAAAFSDYFKNRERKPELLIEPGSAIVGDCMKFAATIKTIKNVRGKWIATITGSQKNISMSGVNPPIEIIAVGEDRNEYVNLDFVGYTCIENDVLYHGYQGQLAHEDVIVFGNCGSYSVVMKPPFILPNFPVLDIGGNEPLLIKRKETFEDLFCTYNF